MGFIHCPDRVESFPLKAGALRSQRCSRGERRGASGAGLFGRLASVLGIADGRLSLCVSVAGIANRELSIEPVFHLGLNQPFAAGKRDSNALQTRPVLFC